ncbi:MAG: secretin N-terminal domain-containing protein [Vicinamibacterales bacterium]
MEPMMRRVLGGLAVLVVTSVIAGCASGRAFSRGEEAARAGDWESAVNFYRQALQNDPDRPDYKIALERAMIAAAGQYADRARQFEAANQPEEALRAYRKALEFEPSNRQLASKASEIERVLRDRIEAATPRPEIEKLREQARRAIEPVLNPTSREPIIFNFSNTSAREILAFIGSFTGINVTFDSAFADRQISVKLDGVTLEQALQQIMIANGFFYKVLNERTIIVAVDSVPNRNKYEEQVIRTFYLSHADATEVFTMLNNVVRIPGQAVLPTFSANKTANTITVRATAAVVQIVERVIDSIDKPRAEVIVDVQILEVSRERAKQYGLSLSDYAIGAAFSPEVAPPTGDDVAPPFNVNTISSGVSTADFYMSVPSAVIRFLESDSQTKVLAKPQLRGSEGQKLTLNLGEDVPVPSTTFTPLAAGGATTNPLTSYGYRTIGIIVEMEPRVTYEGEVILTISVENSARGQDTNIAGQNLPSFFSRKVQTRLRLRDGESNLLAGLLREDERRSLRGFPGILRLPIVKQLFSDNDQNIRQTDIVMLLTPRIIRTHELRASDLAPIYIGTQGNLALGGPPPVIGGGADTAAQAEAAAAAPGAVTGAPYAPGTPGTKPPIEPVLPTGATARPTVPAGASPIPGMTPAPVAPAPAPAPNTLVSPPPPVEPPVAAPTAPAPTFAAPPTPSAPIPGSARITLSPPGEMRVGGGPYLVPISISGATRLSTVTIAVSYNPALVRVRNVQEGTFMRQGGVNATFTQQVDAATGRIDIAISRAGDQTGASTTGLLAALLLEPITTGTGTLSVSGSASMPGGASAALQFVPATITVR